MITIGDMKIKIGLMAMVFFLFQTACNSKDKRDIVQINLYQDIPGFVRKFLDSSTGGKFAIAEPGKSWDAGCVKGSGPSRKFITAYLSKDQVRMKYMTGGLVTSTHELVIRIAYNKVVWSTSFLD